MYQAHMSTNLLKSFCNDFFELEESEMIFVTIKPFEKISDYYIVTLSYLGHDSLDESFTTGIMSQWWWCSLFKKTT